MLRPPPPPDIALSQSPGLLGYRLTVCQPFSSVFIVSVLNVVVYVTAFVSVIGDKLSAVIEEDQQVCIYMY